MRRNRSNKTYSARLTRWLVRLAHFTINVNQIAGKHLAVTDYLSRNPSAPPQTDDVYDEEYVINNILPHYKFISKYGCLSNHANQSETGTTKSERKTNNEPRSRETREQTAIDCLNNLPSTRKTHSQNSLNPKITMDARTIDNLEATDSSPETTELIQRWRDIVKPGIYRLTGGKWKKIPRTKIPQKREKSNRGAITRNYARPTTRRPKTKNRSAAQRRFPATNQTIGTRDTRSILERGPTNTGPTATTRPKPT